MRLILDIQRRPNSNREYDLTIKTIEPEVKVGLMFGTRTRSGGFDAISWSGTLPHEIIKALDEEDDER